MSYERMEVSNYFRLKPIFELKKVQELPVIGWIISLIKRIGEQLFARFQNQETGVALSLTSINYA